MSEVDRLASLLESARYGEADARALLMICREQREQAERALKAEQAKVARLIAALQEIAEMKGEFYSGAEMRLKVIARAALDNTVPY